jgi:hypothetical protein
MRSLLGATIFLVGIHASGATSCDGKARAPTDPTGTGCVAPEAKSINDLLGTIDASCAALCQIPGVAKAPLSPINGANLLGEVLNRVGKCYPVPSKNLAEAKIIPDLKTSLKESPPPEVTKCDGSKASEKDWIAVDLLTRTLMAEVGGRPSCLPNLSPHFVKAVAAVIMNRKNTYENHGDEWMKYTNRKPRADENPLVPMMTNPQFNVWNAKDKWIACPTTEPQQVYKDGHGKTVASTSFKKDLSYINWTIVAEVATNLVFCESEFKKSIGSMDALQYTKDESTHRKRLCEKYTLIEGVKIDGNPIQDVNCVELWTSPFDEGRLSAEQLRARQAEAAACESK